MKISLKTWMAYTARLREVNNKAAEELISWVRDQGGYDGLDREALIRIAHALATKYGEAAAAAACDIYDATAIAQGVRVPPAEPAPTATFGETAKAVVGTLKQTPLKVPSTVGRLVKQAGADTVLHNAARDGAEFAWIPAGDTCPFCLMLASNGWQKQSAKKAKAHAGHIHANCDCQYAVRFDGKSSVEGYEPEKYREIYENAEGDTPEEKLRSMQRQQRAEQRDEVNARKRVAYRRKKSLLDSGNSGNMNIDKAPTALSIHNMHNTSDTLFERAKHVVPIKGYDDVFIHGDARGVATKNADGKEVSIPGTEFIKALKELPFDNKAIRLCACETGALDNGFAWYVAKEMNMPVMAPTTKVWITMPDTSGVSDMILCEANDENMPDYSKPGHWRIFNPNGSIEEVEQ